VDCIQISKYFLSQLTDSVFNFNITKAQKANSHLLLASEPIGLIKFNLVTQNVTPAKRAKENISPILNFLRLNIVELGVEV